MTSSPLSAETSLSRDREDAEFFAFDAAAESARICEILKAQIFRKLRRRGAVIGLSGGIDSSVCAALSAHALGPKHVLAVLMPEHDSDPESLRLGRLVAESLGIEYVEENIGPILEAAGCYERRDHFVRLVVPEFGEDWRCKLALPNTLQNNGYNISRLVVESPTGETRDLRVPAEVYRGLVAATNMKQRTRKQVEYFHADRLDFAVVGTPNRLEYDQGFFVKGGDGLADVKPIAHLYKTSVYRLAEYFGIPEEIRRRTPTTDTWSLRQTQEEFYFSLPYHLMDICLYGLNNGVSASEVARRSGLTEEQVERVWKDIRSKRMATSYLHQGPLLSDAIAEIKL
jgi:NAD+ synthase